MLYESDTRFVAKTVGWAVIAALFLLLMLLGWFTTIVEGGTPEERYLTVVVTFFVCIFIVCFAAHLVIQIRLEESDKQKIEFLLGHTIKPGEIYHDETRDTEEYSAEN